MWLAVGPRKPLWLTGLKADRTAESRKEQQWEQHMQRPQGRKGTIDVAGLSSRRGGRQQNARPRGGPSGPTSLSVGHGQWERPHRKLYHLICTRGLGHPVQMLGLSGCNSLEPKSVGKLSSRYVGDCSGE